MAPLSSFLLSILALTTPILSQSSSATPSTIVSSAAGTSTSSASTSTRTSSSSNSTAPDVLLYVPQLSVGRIELDVDNLQADINLNANIANLVTINAGVQVSVTKINVTIADVEAELELIVRLGHLVDIVERVFESLDLNPLLINVLNDVTSVVTAVIGAVDGLLGSITQGGSILNFVIDSLGNIIQSTTGELDSIVGNYLTNMTATGVTESLGNGLTQKQYLFDTLGTLVNIMFNTAGQIVGQPTVVKSTTTSSSTATATATPTSSTAAAAATTAA